MTREEALRFVNAEIERIEFQNAGKELRPWERDACPAATEHWRRVRQRIALEKGKIGRDGAACLREFGYLGNTAYWQRILVPTPKGRRRGAFKNTVA